jgi:hypothetical protein
MKRLTGLSRLLAAVLIALGARILIAGPNPTSNLSAAISATLLLGSILLARYGRRHAPRTPVPEHKQAKRRA